MQKLKITLFRDRKLIFDDQFQYKFSDVRDKKFYEDHVEGWGL